MEPLHGTSAAVWLNFTFPFMLNVSKREDHWFLYFVNINKTRRHG